MSLATAIVGISERAVQDTANLATTSGVNCSDIVSGISGCLPGPTIDRGMETLKYTDNRLKDHVLPIDREKRFYIIHDRLFATGEQLDEKRKRSGRLDTVREPQVTEQLSLKHAECSEDGGIELLPRTPPNPTESESDLKDPAGVVEGQDEVLE
ncbi:hypothetical protein C8Q79DRAFT_1010728 [Trametes meyenii]|nr:hypothetical protein C8Q79DRAFT_1010728 [Trametes meyenii]